MNYSLSSQVFKKSVMQRGGAGGLVNLPVMQRGGAGGLLNRPIRDAATGKIAMISSSRGNRFSGTTNTTAALGAWEDTFGSLTKGISDIANSVSNVIGAVKGQSPTFVVGGSQQPYNPTLQPVYNPYYNPYMPYTPTNPNIPAYNYPQVPAQPTTTKTNNTALYTALGVAALGLIIYLKK